MNTISFDADDIGKIVRGVGLDQLMDNAIEAITRSCETFDERTTTVPVREGFEYSEPSVGLVEWMPAMKSGQNMVIKIVGYHPGNPTVHNVPTILSTALSFDTRTGQLVALLDGTFLTALRTGAASAVASRILARADSAVLGLLGAGCQAISQLHALSRVFPLREVIVFDTDPATAASFADRAAGLGLADVSYRVGMPEEIVSAVDILCTATSVDIGEGPVFRDVTTRPGLHINAVGSDFPGKVEVPHSLLERSLVCPDFIPQARREGECQQLRPDQVGPDLVELVRNAADYRRLHGDSCTVFDSTGWAFEDYIVAEMLIAHGRQLGCGKEIELTRLSEDPKNPYAFLQPRPAAGADTAEAVVRSPLLAANQP